MQVILFSQVRRNVLCSTCLIWLLVAILNCWPAFWQRLVQYVLIHGCLRTGVAINSVAEGFDHLHPHSPVEHTDSRKSKTPYTMNPSSLQYFHFQDSVLFLNAINQRMRIFLTKMESPRSSPCVCIACLLSTDESPQHSWDKTDRLFEFVL